MMSLAMAKKKSKKKSTKKVVQKTKKKPSSLKRSASVSKKTKKKSSSKKKPSKGAGSQSVPFPDHIVIRRAENVVSRINYDNSVAIMKLDNDECFFTIDGIAAEAWELINGNSDIGRIKKTLIKRHSPPVNVFNRDLANLISELQSEQLIEL